MATHRIFHPLLARLVLVAAAPALVVAWIAGPIPGAAAGVALLAGELWRIRRAVVTGMPDEITFVPTRPTEHPWLDTEAFRHALDGLAAAGFTPVADYRVAYPGSPRCFARALLNPEHQVYAEVSQSRQGGVDLPVATTLHSVMEGGWSVETTSRPPVPVSVAFMRAPRAAWRSLPCAEPQELLDDHLALRERMCADLGVGVVGEGSLEGYFAVQRDAHRARVEALRATNVVAGIARGVSCERSTPSEWLGDYAPASLVVG